MCICVYVLQDDSETIDFREYVIGLSLASEPVNSEDSVFVYVCVCVAG